MSKPRRPRNARPAQKAFVAQPVVSETVPSSDAENAAVDTAEPETVPADLMAADPAPEHPTEALDAAPIAAFEVPAISPETAAAGETSSDDIREAAPSPSQPAVALPPYNAASFGTTVMNYVIGEGEAFAAHMRALAGARSMADFVRLQIGEFQRAADATLTCWGILAFSASRTASLR